MDSYRVQLGEKVDLTARNPGDKSMFQAGKQEGKAHLARLRDELRGLQELLWAENANKVLIVLQAMDTGGKDGTIRHVFRGTNPQGVKVVPFKKPTPEELDHDFLWRVHEHTPGNGEIVIFNRSHYEDVLVVRVHGLVEEHVWRRRYSHINEFEQMLAEEGTTILKFFLHIDLAEQKKRLQARLDDPTKHWKFNVADLAERKRWGEYMTAYEEAIASTSTEWAPWYIVPANRKWYRNLVVSTVLVETLQRLDMSYPEPEGDLDDVVIE